MTAVNHVLAGALIGAGVHQPVLAISLAVASHYVMDALPHFGFGYKNWEERLKHRRMVNYMATYDILILAIVIVLLLRVHPSWLVITCAFAAIFPDLIWIYRFTIPEKWGTVKPTKGIWLTQVHYKIQKFEFKEGIFVEILTTLGLGILAFKVF